MNNNKQKIPKWHLIANIIDVNNNMNFKWECDFCHDITITNEGNPPFACSCKGIFKLYPGTQRRGINVYKLYVGVSIVDNLECTSYDKINLRANNIKDARIESTEILTNKFNIDNIMHAYIIKVYEEYLYEYNKGNGNEIIKKTN